METETLLAQYQHFMQDAALVRLHRDLPPPAGAGRLPGPAVKRRNALPAAWETRGGQPPAPGQKACAGLRFLPAIAKSPLMWCDLQHQGGFWWLFIF